MRVCITAKGANLDSPVDPTFGRASSFLFVDPETMEVEAVENAPGAHGAGVQAAQAVADRHAAAVITGSVGPNAHRGLTAAGIEIYVGAGGTARDALAAYRDGRLERADAPTGGRHGHKGGS